MPEPPTSLVLIPARCGIAAFIERGQQLRVINTHGTQVVDTWAFCRQDMSEFMSMEHTRAHLLALSPTPGSTFYSNRRRPILTLLADTSGGRHDTLIAACDRYRYELLGCTTYHPNCTDNLAASLSQLGLRATGTPSPLNLFMNVPVASSGSLSFAPPVSAAGSYVILRAEMDLVIAFSACPQDMIPVNGIDCQPVNAHFELLGGSP